MFSNEREARLNKQHFKTCGARLFPSLCSLVFLSLLLFYRISSVCLALHACAPRASLARALRALWHVDRLGSIVALLGTILGRLGAILALAPSWRVLAPSWLSLARLSAILARLGIILARFGAIFARLGVILGDLGAILRDLGAILGHLGVILGRLGAILGTSWPPKPRSRSVRDLSKNTVFP